MCITCSCLTECQGVASTIFYVQQVLDLKRECKNYLQTILRLSQENEYLKTLTHQADSPPSTSLLNEELKSRLIVSATDSVVTCGIDQSLNECCGDGSESSENGLTVATLQDRVCNSNKEHQSQHDLGTNSCQHQKEDSQQVHVYTLYNHRGILYLVHITTMIDVLRLFINYCVFVYTHIHADKAFALCVINEVH